MNDFAGLFRRLLLRPWLTGATCLFVALFFHSPRWWLIIHESPGSFEWTRAISYLRQCGSPLTLEVEPAMRWRFLPQSIVFLCGGNRGLAFAFPWIGAWCFLWYIYSLARRETADDVASFYVTLLIACTAPVFVSTGWLGVNDAWVALGLVYCAFGRRKILLACACGLCPWIDERFIFGLPIALTIRMIRDERALPFGPFLLKFVYYNFIACLPFLIGRVGGKVVLPARDGNVDFIRNAIHYSPTYLWMAPLGAWMALRFAYFPAALETISLYKERRAIAIFLATVSVVSVGLGFLLAADTTRTAGILVPLAVWGAIEGIKRRADLRLGWLVAASLLVPVAHVTMIKVSAINSLPVELWRLLR